MVFPDSLQYHRFWGELCPGRFWGQKQAKFEEDLRWDTMLDGTRSHGTGTNLQILY